MFGRAQTSRFPKGYLNFLSPLPLLFSLVGAISRDWDFPTERFSAANKVENDAGRQQIKFETKNKVVRLKIPDRKDGQTTSVPFILLLKINNDWFRPRLQAHLLFVLSDIYGNDLFDPDLEIWGLSLLQGVGDFSSDIINNLLLNKSQNKLIGSPIKRPHFC